MIVVQGSAEILPPLEKSKTRRYAPPNITISDKHARLQALVSRVKGLAAIDMAVVHPCDLESLKGALMAADAGLLDHILIGPEVKIRSIEEEHGLDIKHYRILNLNHSHDSAAMAVTLVRLSLIHIWVASRDRRRTTLSRANCRRLRINITHGSAALAPP